MDSPGVVFLRVPGVDGLAFGHMLRAIFCWREQTSVGIGIPGVPEGLVDSGTVLAGHFSEQPGQEYRRLLSDRRTMKVVVIADPAAVQRRVYRHLIGVQPELLEKRPKVFGSEEGFLASRRDEITRGLAGALGKRRVRVADFDAVLIEERMEESLRDFVGVAVAWADRVNAGRRVKRMLGAVLEFDGSLVEAFGGEGTGQPDAAISGEFAKQNAVDVGFYREASERLVRGEINRRAKRLTFRRWKPTSPAPGEPVFVFNHLPKSYGTSLRQFFGQVFGGIEDQTEFFGKPGLLDETPVDLRRLTADTLLCGHFTHGAFLLQRRYPEIWADSGRFRLFTFVRDPLATAISNFHHVRRHDSEAVSREPELYRSLESYLGALENPIAQRLGCDAGSIDAVLGRYFFVGAAEDHRTGLGVLLERMKTILQDAHPSATVARAIAAVEWLAGQKLEHSNAGGSGEDGLSVEVREEFRRRNSLDHEIYRRALGA